jgi:hypothetical protein
MGHWKVIVCAWARWLACVEMPTSLFAWREWENPSTRSVKLVFRPGFERGYSGVHMSYASQYLLVYRDVRYNRLSFVWLRRNTQLNDFAYEICLSGDTQSDMGREDAVRQSEFGRWQVGLFNDIQRQEAGQLLGSETEYAWKENSRALVVSWGMRKATISFNKEPGAPLEILSGQLPNTSHKLYNLKQFASSSTICNYMNINISSALCLHRIHLYSIFISSSF